MRVWVALTEVLCLSRNGNRRVDFEGRKDPDCERASTIAVTIIAGPLNYVGVNPKVDECDLPEPSK